MIIVFQTHAHTLFTPLSTSSTLSWNSVYPLDPTDRWLAGPYDHTANAYTHRVHDEGGNAATGNQNRLLMSFWLSRLCQLPVAVRRRPLHARFPTQPAAKADLSASGISCLSLSSLLADSIDAGGLAAIGKSECLLFSLSISFLIDVLGLFLSFHFIYSFSSRCRSLATHPPAATSSRIHGDISRSGRYTFLPLTINSPDGYRYTRSGSLSVCPKLFNNTLDTQDTRPPDCLGFGSL